MKNPMNPHQISRIGLSPETVDCIVFWTKNPEAMIPGLERLKDYKYYFQFTLTGYGHDVEPGLPDKRKRLIPTFLRLADRIGKEKAVLRYDPILLSDRYTVEYHLNAFHEIAGSLKGYTEKVIISFIDLYAKTVKNTRNLNMIAPQADQIRHIAQGMAEIAHMNGMVIESCAEEMDLSEYGIAHGSCIDQRMIERIIGGKIKASKDKNQRQSCGCIESIDIGTYDTCRCGCKYCYANYSSTKVSDGIRRYDMNSPLLCGSVNEDDKITERKTVSLKM